MTPTGPAASSNPTSGAPRLTRDTTTTLGKEQRP